MIAFGENIYLWRISKNLTQKQLAEKSGIPRPNLSAIENGKREVSLPTLRALAVAFGVSAGALADGVTPPYFKKRTLTRESLEGIARAALKTAKKPSASVQKDISHILARLIVNRVNAAEKKYTNVLKNRQNHTANWLMLKASLGAETIGSLLARIDKHIELSRH